MLSFNNLTVDELTGRGLMSVRARNVCKRNQMFHLASVYAYYEIHKTFIGLPYLGEATNRCLVELCSQPDNLPMAENKEDESESRPTLAAPADAYPIIAIYRLLPKADHWLAETWYRDLVCRLSRLEMRALFAVYKTKSLAGLIQGLETTPSTFSLLASKLLPKGADLNGFLTALTEALSTNGFPQDVNDQAAATLAQQISKVVHCNDKRIEDFIDHNLPALTTGMFPLLDFVDLILQCSATLPPTYQGLLHHSNLIYRKETPLSEEELSQRLGVPAKRIKALYQSPLPFGLLFERLAYVIELLQTAGLVIPASLRLADAPYHFYTTGTADENGPFTNLFLAYVLSWMNPRFRLFAECRDGKTGVLFVNSKFETWFDTQAFFSLLERKHVNGVFRNYETHLPHILQPYLKGTPSPGDREQLYAILMPMLTFKYNTFTREKRRSKLQRRYKSLWQVPILDFIQTKDRHCHTDEIVAYLREKGYAVTCVNVKKYITRNRDVFSAIGNHLYGLQKWEQSNRWQKEPVVTLVTNYLSAYQAPKHICEISRHVQRYKPMTPGEVLTALLPHRNSSVVAVAHSFFSVPGKDYSAPVLLPGKIRAYWLEKATCLFAKAPGGCIDKREMIDFIASLYKIRKEQAAEVIVTRTKTGEFEETETGLLRLGAA